MNALSFYRMETYEISERYITPCFVNGLEAFDGEVNLAFDENLISNEFAVKLCLDYEVKKGKKLVKKELIVALKGELYFVKFIINPEEDDFEPGVILGRSFLRLAQGVVDFGNGVITIYPEPDPFEEDSEKTGKSSDDWDQLLDFNFDDVPKSGEELPPFVCKMGKSNRNKKRAMENLNLFYQDIGPSSSTGRHLTQEEAAKEELAIRISQRYALLEEERPVIETMAYNDKYKKILDEIWKDKVELDGKTVKEDKEAVKRIKGEALKEKDDPGAFIFPIRLEGKVNKNALADTGSDINTMPYRIFETLGREDMKKVDRGITMINHTQAEAMGKLSNVLCQVGVTTIIAKFLILDIPIDRDAPIVVGQGFLHMMGSILNASERIFSTFDGVCHQTFRAARFDVLITVESDSDDEEDYTSGTHNGEAGSSRSKRPRQHEPVEELYNTRLGPNASRTIYSPCIVNWDVLNQMGYDGEIDDMLRIRVRKDASEEELQSRRSSKFRLGDVPTVDFVGILLEDWGDHKLSTYGCVKWTTRYDKVFFFQKNDLWLLSMFDASDTTMDMQYVVLGDLEGIDEEERSWDSKRESNLMWDLDTITLRDLIDSDGKIILEDPQPGVPRVGIPRPPRASMYHGVFEHMAGVYSVPTHLATLSRSMTSIISSTHHHHRSSSRMMTSSVEMTRVGYVTACFGSHVF
ncbi:pescadillo [Tanacetum coccineum]